MQIWLIKFILKLILRSLLYFLAFVGLSVVVDFILSNDPQTRDELVTIFWVSVGMSVINMLYEYKEWKIKFVEYRTEGKLEPE